MTRQALRKHNKSSVINPLLTIIKTQLPPDYIELEKRVDALKQVHQKLLQVTSVQFTR